MLPVLRSNVMVPSVFPKAKVIASFRKYERITKLREIAGYHILLIHAISTVNYEYEISTASVYSHPFRCL
jgi:hypothetical protein